VLGPLHIPLWSDLPCNFNRGLLTPASRPASTPSTEIISTANGSVADTIYFGGGMRPLAPEEVARLITACRESFAVTRMPVTLGEPETATQTSARQLPGPARRA
jgi:hypothetical protein